MTRAPRLLVLVLERTILSAWSVVEALAEVTVTVVEVREARKREARQRATRQRATRPPSPGVVGHEAAPAGERTRPAPCAALTAPPSKVGGSLRV